MSGDDSPRPLRVGKIQLPSHHVPPEELVGNIAAERLRRMGERLRAAKSRMDALLREVGEPATCRACKAHVMVLRHASRERHTSYNLDGAVHACAAVSKPR
jgi:hypothetical protein